ncbi:hypothetical protein ACQCVE_10095 [Metabacillus sp. 113a]|uniref:hypothetical protein n=1 Tax=Metabacillus sp. 113a TaxID=3404706 RepID=UPI003CE68AE8
MLPISALLSGCQSQQKENIVGYGKTGNEKNVRLAIERTSGIEHLKEISAYVATMNKDAAEPLYEKKSIDYVEENQTVTINYCKKIGNQHPVWCFFMVYSKISKLRFIIPFTQDIIPFVISG